jgi:putative cardiolipin synthase
MIEDPVLAATFADYVDKGLRGNAYEVTLNERGQLRWRSSDNCREVIYDKEPQTTWSQRFRAFVARIIPAGQL